HGYRMFPDSRQPAVGAGGPSLVCPLGRYHRHALASSHAGLPRRDRRRQSRNGSTIVAATLPPHPDSENEAALSPRNMRLGEILLERGKIEPADIERALELQLERGDKIGKILVDMGTV